MRAKLPKFGAHEGTGEELYSDSRSITQSCEYYTGREDSSRIDELGRMLVTHMHLCASRFEAHLLVWKIEVSESLSQFELRTFPRCCGKLWLDLHLPLGFSRFRSRPFFSVVSRSSGPVLVLRKISKNFHCLIILMTGVSYTLSVNRQCHWTAYRREFVSHRVGKRFLRERIKQEIIVKWRNGIHQFGQGWEGLLNWTSSRMQLTNDGTLCSADVEQCHQFDRWVQTGKSRIISRRTVSLSFHFRSIVSVLLFRLVDAEGMSCPFFLLLLSWRCTLNPPTTAPRG